MKLSKVIFISIPTLILSGCQLFSSPTPYVPPEPVEVITIEVKPEIYQPPLPQPIQFEDVRWVVITDDNLEDKMDEVEKFTGNDFVVFAVTPHDYENLAYNFQEVRRYIRQLLETVLYYREVTATAPTEE